MPQLDTTSLTALQIAFAYMPKEENVTRFEYGDCYDKVIAHIHAVRQVLQANGINPDSVGKDILPCKEGEGCAPN